MYKKIGIFPVVVLSDFDYHCGELLKKKNKRSEKHTKNRKSYPTLVHKFSPTWVCGISSHPSQVALDVTPLWYHFSWPTAYTTLLSGLCTFIWISCLSSATERSPQCICKEKVKLHLKGACLLGKLCNFSLHFLEDFCCRVSFSSQWLDL